MFKPNINSPITQAEISDLLNLSNPDDIKLLYQKAYQKKLDEVGNFVYYRGIIELSNICQKNCYYCGIRKDNKKVKRYMMTREEIIESALWAHEQNYGSIVLQSGERDDDNFVKFIDDILNEIHQKTNGNLGITLSLGEQAAETYRRWFESGAHRYLLRIESSSPALYSKIHPSGHSYHVRRNCLVELRKIGYQVGTGVMIGLPYQTIDDLSNDILFYKDMDIDMIGMGPYIHHPDTPFSGITDDTPSANRYRFQLGLKMIAATRLVLDKVNIAATTAMQALDPIGREKALRAGANIIMPNITPLKYREDYLLYDNKPCTDEDNSACLECLEKRIELAGDNIGYGEWGDSPHFFQRNKN